MQEKFSTQLVAGFSNVLGAVRRTCETVGSDTCYASTCDELPDDAPVERNPPVAGTLTLTSADATGSLTVTPDALGRYYDGVNTFAVGFLGIGQGVITASGGEVPAFEQTFDVPEALLLTEPAYDTYTPQEFSRGSDVTLQWLGGTEGVILNVQGDSERPDGMPGRVTFYCALPSATGSGVLPGAALQALASGTSLQVRTMRSVAVTAGEYDVSVLTTFPVYNETGDVVVAPKVE
jgi:hypothetical protein